MASSPEQRALPGSTPLPIKEIHVLWITSSLGFDGDTIAMTAATQPSIEDIHRKCREFGVPVLLRSRRRLAFRAALGDGGRGQAPKVSNHIQQGGSCIITKLDLADAVEFDEVAARRNIQAVGPGMEVFKPWPKTGQGINEYLEVLENRRTRSRAAAAV